MPPPGWVMRHWFWIGPLLFMFVVSLYVITRTQGQWAESDSTTFANVIRAFASDGHLVPAQGEVYPNGYAYQAISAFLLAVTGVDVAVLQQLVYLLVAPLVVLPAWVLYRELTGSARGATITTALLFMQPEFLFVILRSSHEKFTRVFMLLCLFLLVRSFKLHDQPRRLAVHVALFALTAFALVASNSLLAYSFILSLAFAAVLGVALVKRNPVVERQNRQVLIHLFFAALIGAGLAYIFTVHIYPPARHDLAVLQGIWDRTAVVVQDVGAQASDPYTQVAGAWVDPGLPVYLLVSIANWIVLVISLVIWVWQGLRWLLRGQGLTTQGSWLLWLLYVAFAAQGMLSVVADVSGTLSSNLQHRLFPSFSIIAVAFVGMTLARWRPRRAVRPIQLGLSVGIFCVAILSVFKATNEPVLSNKWTFYRSNELAALDWVDAHLQNTVVWTEYDERLAVSFRTERGDSANRNRFVHGQVQPSTRDMLLTTVSRLRSSRLRQPLPVPPDALRVYDNGGAEHYHVRPRTPYQE